MGPTKELSLAWSNIASAFRVPGVAGMYHHASFKKSYQLSSFYNNFIAKVLDTFPHKAVQAFLPKSRESGSTKYTCIFLNSVWSNGSQQPCFTLTFSHRGSCLCLEYQNRCLTLHSTNIKALIANISVFKSQFCTQSSLRPARFFKKFRGMCGWLGDTDL